MNDKFFPKNRLSPTTINFLKDDVTQFTMTPSDVSDINTLAKALEELRIYHAELEIQNIELQQALTSLDELKQHYQHLFDDNPLPSIVLDKSGVVQEFNKSTKEYFKSKPLLKNQTSLYRFLEQKSGMELAERLLRSASTQFTPFTLTFYQPELMVFDCVLNCVPSDGSAFFLLIMRDRRLETELEHERELFRRVVETCSDAIFVIDKHFNLVASNQLANEFLGFTAEFRLPVKIDKAIPAKIHTAIKNYLLDDTHSTHPESFSFNSELQSIDVRHKDYICRIFVADATDPNNELIGVMLTDNTAMLQSQLQIDLAEQIFKESAQAIMITSDKGDILYVNKAFETITEFTSSDILGKNPKVLSSGIHRNDFYQQFWHAINSTGRWQGEIWNRRKSGQAYPQWLTVNRISFGEHEHRFIALFSDITEQKAIESRIKNLAYGDQLTGVGNRNALFDLLEHQIQSSPDTNFGLMFLDLDYFKYVNDAHGHDTGDILLKQVVHRIRNVIRSTDKLFRIGGDEFVIFFNNLCASQMAEKAHKINIEIDKPFCTKNRQLFTSCSIGITLYPVDAKDSESLLKHADIAMYKAKTLGRNRFQFFDESLSTEIERRVLIAQKLKHALLNNELTFAAQPMFGIVEQRPVSQELLVRWIDSGIPELNPEEFISIAEEDSSIIMAIDKQAIRTALDIIAKRPLDNRDMRIGVNLSDHDFIDPKNFEAIVTLCNSYPEQAKYLDIEVTERVVMREPKTRIKQFTALRDLGIRILIDDFGTGYSSFSYLMEFPIDAVKIDRSFIWNMEKNPKALAIVKTIIELSHNLKLEVIAEGVETESQAEMLLKLGCEVGQGYYYAKPQLLQG